MIRRISFEGNRNKGRRVGKCEYNCLETIFTKYGNMNQENNTTQNDTQNNRPKALALSFLCNSCHLATTPTTKSSYLRPDQPNVSIMKRTHFIMDEIAVPYLLLTQVTAYLLEDLSPFYCPT